MAHLNKKSLSAKSVDLTGFLDILSILFSVQIFMLCILSLSTGYKAASNAQSPAKKEKVNADFVIIDSKTNNRVRRASLLHCSKNVVNQYDSTTKSRIGSSRITDYATYSPANMAEYDSLYILVESSCFSLFEKLLKDIRDYSSVRVGYDPLPDDHNIRWLK